MFWGKVKEGQLGWFGIERKTVSISVEGDEYGASRKASERETKEKVDGCRGGRNEGSWCLRGRCRR